MPSSASSTLAIKKKLPPPFETRLEKKKQQNKKSRRKKNIYEKKKNTKSTAHKTLQAINYLPRKLTPLGRRKHPWIFSSISPELLRHTIAGWKRKGPFGFPQEFVIFVGFFQDGNVKDSLDFPNSSVFGLGFPKAEM